MKNTIVALTAAALVAVLSMPATAAAQKPVSMGAEVSKTFTIVAIDSGARVVTLKDDAGLTSDVYCGPEVERFNALKVGDKVTFRYYESVVSMISRPGTAPKAPVTGGVSRAAGAKPGATFSEQMNATVTIEAIDPKVPSVTVRTADGNKMSFKVENKKNIEGYKAGDKVDITYTRALAISVK